MSVKLTASDVPGASLKTSALCEYSVKELRRWLECRGLQQAGRKEELIERITNCISNGREDAISLAVDGGKWYDQKRNILTAASSSRNAANVELTQDDVFLTNIKYETFPSVDVPIYFNKGHIFSYIILNVVNHGEDFEYLNEETGTTEKPFRKASQFVQSGNLADIVDGSNDKYYMIKCKCHASFKKKMYNVTVALNKLSGAVVRGKCECVQSALGKCSHVTALLTFLWEHVTKVGYSAASNSCTSRLREWGVGTMNRDPGSINLKEYQTIRFNFIKRTNFDPRPSAYGRTEMINNFVADLQTCSTRSMFEAVLKIKYDDFAYDAGEIDVFKNLVFIFKANMVEYMKNFQHIFEMCHEQNNETWLSCRRYFLTGSIIKQVCSFTCITSKRNFLYNHLWKTDQDFVIPAMEYGKKNEINAKTAYQATLKEGETLVDFGLVVNKKYPFLAASVDGAVVKNNSIIRLVEYKCPYILQKCNPKDFKLHLTRTQLNSFCLEIVNNVILLKKNHKYAYQIALYMLIFEVDECDLVIWSPVDSITLKITKTAYMNCILSNMSKMSAFYYNFFVPEMFMMRTPRQLDPVELE